MSSVLSDYKSSSTFFGKLKIGKDWVLLNISNDTFQSIIKTIDLQSLSPKITQSPHISVIKNEKPSKNAEDWFEKRFDGEIIPFLINSLKLSHNGCHVWIDAYSSRLCEIREHFGLVALKKDDLFRVNFHITIGKMNPYRIPMVRKVFRLSNATHIDEETLMQHI